MLIDITGTILIPGNGGSDCPGNGSHYDANGRLIECCCDECDYMICCIGAGCEDCKGEKPSFCRREEGDFIN